MRPATLLLFVIAAACVAGSDAQLQRRGDLYGTPDGPPVINPSGDIPPPVTGNSGHKKESSSTPSVGENGHKKESSSTPSVGDKSNGKEASSSSTTPVTTDSNPNNGTAVGGSHDTKKCKSKNGATKKDATSTPSTQSGGDLYDMGNGGATIDNSTTPSTTPESGAGKKDDKKDDSKKSGEATTPSKEKSQGGGDLYDMGNGGATIDNSTTSTTPESGAGKKGDGKKSSGSSSTQSGGDLYGMGSGGATIDNSTTSTTPESGAGKKNDKNTGDLYGMDGNTTSNADSTPSVPPNDLVGSGHGYIDSGSFDAGHNSNKSSETTPANKNTSTSNNTTPDANTGGSQSSATPQDGNTGNLYDMGGKGGITPDTGSGSGSGSGSDSNSTIPEGNQGSSSSSTPDNGSTGSHSGSSHEQNKCICNNHRHCIYLDNALTTGLANETSSAKDTEGMVCEKYDSSGNGLGCCSFPKTSKTQVVCGLESITVDFGCKGTVNSWFSYDNGTSSANFSAVWSDQRGGKKNGTTSTDGTKGKGGYDPFLENKSDNATSGAYGEATATDPSATTNRKRGMLKRMHRNIRRTEVVPSVADVSNTTSALSTGLSAASKHITSHSNGVDLYITCSAKTDGKKSGKKSSKHDSKDKKGSKKDASSSTPDLTPSTGDKNSTVSSGSNYDMGGSGSTPDLGGNNSTKSTQPEITGNPTKSTESTTGKGSSGDLYGMDGLTPSVNNSTDTPSTGLPKGKSVDKSKDKSADKTKEKSKSTTPETVSPVIGGKDKPKLADLNNPGYLDGAP